MSNTDKTTETTDETTTPTDTETMDQDTTTDEENTVSADSDDTTKTGNAEAAKWRRKLRDTEAELDKLTEAHTALLRSNIEEMAKGTVPAAALWDSGADLAALIGEDGLPDPGKVAAAASAAAEKYQINLGPRRPAPVPEAGRVPTQHRGLTWGDALRYNNR